MHWEIPKKIFVVGLIKKLIYKFAMESKDILNRVFY